MELKKYLKIIYKRLWIIVLFAVVSTSISAYVSLYLIKPVYEANTTLFVNNKEVDSPSSIAYNDVMAGQLLVKDYSELIKSRTVTSNVIDELKLKGITPKGLADKISVSSKNDTRIIQIKVRYEDPKNARDITDKVGGIFITKAIELMKIDNVGIVDKAEFPLAPVNPNLGIKIIIALATAIMSAIGIIFFLEYLNNKIKTVDDVEKYLELRVLGTIPLLNIV